MLAMTTHKPSLYRKIDVSLPKNEPIYFMGISSSVGAAVIASQLNLYLNIELEFHKYLTAKNQNIVIEQFMIFKNFKEEEIEPSSIDIDLDLMDFSFEEAPSITKLVLIQNRGVNSQIFPKITQLDYLILSNYTMEDKLDLIKSMPDMSYCFSLEKKHIGSKFKFCSELLYS